MDSKKVVNAVGTHSASVILLHGLGDQGSSWEPVASQMGMPWVKFIFPSAKGRPVTINMGAVMPAWADIKGLSPDAEEDEAGTLKTAQIIHELIAEEVKAGIKPERIVVGGFSQGAAMACIAALTHEKPLGGCFILSGWLALRNKVQQIMKSDAKKVPFFQAHGKSDMVVPYTFGVLSSHALQMLGVPLEFKEYPMGHESCFQELQDLKAFLRKCIPDAPAPPPPRIPDNYTELSTKELKNILKERKIDSSDCFEKSDLVAKVRAAAEKEAKEEHEHAGHGHSHSHDGHACGGHGHEH